MTQSQIEKLLDALQTGVLNQIEVPAAVNLRPRIYYFAKKRGMKISIRDEKGLWYLTLSKKKTLGNRGWITTSEKSLQLVYALAIVINNNCLSRANLTNLFEEEFNSWSPSPEVFENISITFSHNGMSMVPKPKEEEDIFDE